MGQLFLCIWENLHLASARAPLMLIPGWRPPQLLNVAYNRDPACTATQQPRAPLTASIQDGSRA